MLIREGNDISNIHSKFQNHTINKSFKMATVSFLRWQPPPLPAIFDGYLTLPPGTPDFFKNQNDRKECTLDYL